MTPENVHDNWVYAHAVDYDARTVVLHTVYVHADPAEYTDVVFEGVVVHHFEQQKVSRGDDRPANVMFDVEESDPLFVLSQYAELLTRTKNYGWPDLGYLDVADLASQLTASGARCFDVQGVCGLSGFVFATSMRLLARGSRADVIAGRPT